MSSSRKPYTRPAQSIKSHIQRVAVLSDNDLTFNLVSAVLSIETKTSFLVEHLRANELGSVSLSNYDAVLLDRLYAGVSYREHIESICQSIDSDSKTAPNLFLLLEEDFLNEDVEGLASAVRSGVFEFLTKHTISSKRIQADFADATDYANTQRKGLTSQARLLEKDDAASSIIHETEPAEVESTIHQLSVDLSSNSVHLSSHQQSTFLSELGELLPLNKWYELLKEPSASEFKQLLEAARLYQKLPPHIFGEFGTDVGDFSFYINDFQVNNDGRGNVLGLNAILTVEQAITKPSVNASGFDNLGNYASTNFESNNLWRNVTRSLPMLCMVLDEEGKIAKVINDRGFSSINTEHFTVGECLSVIIDELDQTAIEETIQRTLNTGKSFEKTIGIVTDRSVRWLETHMVKLYGDAGLSRQVVWSAFDITETRHSHLESLKDKDRYFRTINEAPLLYFCKEQNHRFQNSNLAFLEHYSLDSSELIGKQNTDLFIADMLNIYNQIDDKCLIMTEPFDFLADEPNHQVLWKIIKTVDDRNPNNVLYQGYGMLLDAATLTNKADKHSGYEEADKTSKGSNTEFILSGAISSDFTAINSRVAELTMLATSSNSVRYKDGMAAQLKNLSQVIKDAQNKLGIEAISKEGATHTTNLVESTREVIATLKLALPKTLDISVSYENIDNDGNYNLNAGIENEVAKQIIAQMILSAKDNLTNTDEATARVNFNIYNLDDKNLNKLRAALPEHHELVCHASNQAIAANQYVVISVATPTNVTEEEFDQVVENTARNFEKNRRANHSDNIISLAHKHNGRIVLSYQNQQLTFNLLLPKAS